MINGFINHLQRVIRRFSRVGLDSSKLPAELYYADIYLDEFRSRLAERGTQDILEAGCGTGRMMIPLAELGHRITGIDYHRDSLNVARTNLEAKGLKAELKEADLLEALQAMDDASFDCVLAIEALFVNEQYDAIVKHLARVVRPGGLLFISHRTRYFYLAKALAQGHFDDLELVAENGSGHLRKGMHRVFHRWHTREQIESTYASLGLKLLKLMGIGLCSGFGSDPLADLCDPGTLDEAQRRSLRKIEACDDDLVMAGRFVLTVSQKPSG